MYSQGKFSAQYSLRTPIFHLILKIYTMRRLLFAAETSNMEPLSKP